MEDNAVRIRTLCTGRVGHLVEKVGHDVVM